MEFYIKLNWDHIVVRLFHKHRYFIPNDKGLSCPIVPFHEFVMLFTDKNRHEVINSESFDLFLWPAEKLSKPVITLNDLSKFTPVCLHNNEVWLVSVDVWVTKVFLIYFVDFEDAFHFSDVKLIGSGIIKNMQLDYSKLKIHLVVFS